MLAAALVLVARRVVPRIAPRDVPLFLAYGAIGFALFEYLYLLALERTDVSVAVALLYTAPAFVLVISAVVSRERVRSRDVAALALVLAGVLLVSGAARSIVTGAAPLGRVALLAGLGSGLTYGLYTLLGKAALARDYDSLTTVFWSFAIAALALLPFEPPLPAALREPSAIPMLIGLGLVPTLFAYLFYLAALRSLRATTASMLASAEPVIASLLAAGLLGERIAPEQVIGMLAIVIAAVRLARA
jgi:drug/metabolite transporter (DMT)-like permease